MDGIFNIHKAIDMTSHDVVAKIRKILKMRRVGHAGTLDPAASGVLPICVGQATRVAEYLSESGKAYQAEIIFGVVTDTYDREGRVVRTSSTQDLTLPAIEEALPRFSGPQLQVPPSYSAIKLQGQPAYKLARAGAELSLEPRPIVIYQLEIVAWSPPRLTLTIECSKGTYIRSLAYDLGEVLGCGAHLANLIRTRSGPFFLADSISLEQLAGAVATETVAQYLHAPDSALQAYPVIQLDATNTERALHGNLFSGETQIAQPEMAPLVRVYDPTGRFLAIAEWDAGQQGWKPRKVFAEDSA
ncbi:MAG: tRNA pseudouridine(55) synthase TruB [Ktedonobacteraceae bacterium]|nr:tRNA pseudouridine(55) synthase TruB [Chloroflexota bacterium]